MQEIEKLRVELDQIQTEMVVLLRRRFSLAQKIWQIKKEKSLNFTDLNREHTIIHQFDQSISDLAEQQAVQNIFKSVLSETKKYLETKLK